MEAESCGFGSSAIFFATTNTITPTLIKDRRTRSLKISKSSGRTQEGQKKRGHKADGTIAASVETQSNVVNTTLLVCAINSDWAARSSHRGPFDVISDGHEPLGFWWSLWLVFEAVNPKPLNEYLLQPGK
jgi:hypothetical protein